MNVDGIKALIKLDAERDRIESEIGLAESLEKSRRGDINVFKNACAQSEQRIKSFGFFARIFKRKEYFQVKSFEQSKIARYNTEIAKLEEMKQDLEPLKAQLSTVKEDMSFVQQEYKIPEILVKNLQIFSISDDGHLVIDAAQFKPEDMEKLIAKYSMQGNVSDLAIEQRVMAHKTNFYPKDDKILTSFEGQKTFNQYTSFLMPGVSTKSASCRQTSHFTLNGVVQSHAGGDWSQSGICVLEEVSEHEDEFVSEMACDAYIRGSVDVSRAAIKEVTSQVYKTLTPQQKAQDNIVIVNAQTSEQFDNAAYIIMVANNKPIIKAETQGVAHRGSCDWEYENVWGYASKIFEFLRPEHTVHEKGLTLSGDELFKFAYLAQTTIPNYLPYCPPSGVFTVTDSQGKSFDVSRELISAFLVGGFTRNEDGSFTRTDDYKKHVQGLEKLKSMLKQSNEDLQNLGVAGFVAKSKELQGEFCSVIEDYIKSNGLIEIQEEVNRIQKEFDNQPTPTVEEVLSMPVSQLVTFENLKALEVAGKHLSEDVSSPYKLISLSPEGVVVLAPHIFDTNEDLDMISNEECVVPAFAPAEEGQAPVERTLAESIEIANQVKIYLTSQQKEITAPETAPSLPQE